MKLLIFLACVNMHESVSVLAEEPLSLQTAVSLALQNDRKYKIAVEKTNESKKKVLETWGMLWPQLQTGVTYTPQNSASGVSSQIRSQTNIAIVDGQISINPGVFYNSLQSSRDANIVAENAARQTKGETVLQAVNYFYQLILAEDNVEVEKMSTRALKENYQLIAEGSQRGTFATYDDLMAKATYYNEQTKLINAENVLSNAKANLNLYMGRKIYEKIEVDRKSINTALNEISKYILDQNDEEKLVNGFIATALKNRPEVFQIKSNRQMEIHNAWASESIYIWPTFSVVADYGYNQVIRKPQSKSSEAEALLATQIPYGSTILGTSRGSSIRNAYSPGWNSYWSVSLGATYRWGSLVPVDSNNAKAKEARSRVRQHDLELEDFVQSVSQEVQQSWLQLKSASRSLSWQKGSVNTADNLYTTAVRQFRSGTIDNTKLLNAIEALITAKSLYVQALHDFQQAKAQLNKSIGEDYFIF